MSNELIKTANEYCKRHDIKYSEGVILPLSSIMAYFAAECVRAERERIGSDISYIDNLSDYEEREIEMQKLIGELRGGK